MRRYNLIECDGSQDPQSLAVFDKRDVDWNTGEKRTDDQQTCELSLCLIHVPNATSGTCVQGGWYRRPSKHSPKFLRHRSIQIGIIRTGKESTDADGWNNKTEVPVETSTMTFDTILHKCPLDCFLSILGLREYQELKYRRRICKRQLLLIQRPRYQSRLRWKN